MPENINTSILEETCLKEEDKEVLQTIIQKTKEHSKEIEIYLTGSSLADSNYNDVDLIVISKHLKPKDLALKVAKWVDGIVFSEAPYSGIKENESYHGPHPQNCYRVSVSKYNAEIKLDTGVSPFDITAGQKLEEALADRKRKHIKVST